MKTKMLFSIFFLSSTLFFFSNSYGCSKVEDDKILSINRKSRGGWLGVQIQDLTPKLAKSMNLTIKDGAVVQKVEKKSPADSAGIQENDIITEVDGRQIFDSDDLIKVVNRTKAGTKVNIVLLRKNEKKTIPVTLGRNPARHKSFAHTFGNGYRFPHVFQFFGGSRLGLELMNLDDQLGEYFGVKNGEGVLIKKVSKKSEAEKSGFKAGDVIVKVGKENVKGVNDVCKTLEDSYDEGDKADFEVIRKGEHKTISLEIPEDFSEGNFNFNFNCEPGAVMENCPDIDLHLNLDNLKMELEQIRPEIEMLGKNLKIQIKENLNLKNIKEEINKMKPELEKMKKRLKENVGKVIRTSITI